MRVFVSFRRGITDPAVADRIKALLLASSAVEEVLLSPDQPVNPDDEGPRAAAAIGRCDAVVALIGPGWAEAALGPRRFIDDPNDPVRAEITAALGRIIPTVPVLIDGASLPEVSVITPALQGLVMRDSVAVRVASLDRDFPRLLAAIAPDATPGEPPPPPRPASTVEAPEARPAGAFARWRSAPAAVPPPQPAPPPASKPAPPAAGAPATPPPVGPRVQAVTPPAAAPPPDPPARPSGSAPANTNRSRAEPAKAAAAPSRAARIARPVAVVGLALLVGWLFAMFLRDQMPLWRALVAGAL